MVTLTPRPRAPFPAAMAPTGHCSAPTPRAAPTPHPQPGCPLQSLGAQLTAFADKIPAGRPWPRTQPPNVPSLAREFLPKSHRGDCGRRPTPLTRPPAPLRPRRLAPGAPTGPAVSPRPSAAGSPAQTRLRADAASAWAVMGTRTKLDAAGGQTHHNRRPTRAGASALHPDCSAASRLPGRTPAAAAPRDDLPGAHTVHLSVRPLVTCVPAWGLDGEQTMEWTQPGSREARGGAEDPGFAARASPRASGPGLVPPASAPAPCGSPSKNE